MSLTKLSLPLETNLSTIGHMVRLIQLDNPYVENPYRLKVLIEENFGVSCKQEDIGKYIDLNSESEDFELEDRRQQYGISF